MSNTRRDNHAKPEVGEARLYRANMHRTRRYYLTRTVIRWTAASTLLLLWAVAVIVGIWLMLIGFIAGADALVTGL